MNFMNSKRIKKTPHVASDVNSIENSITYLEDGGFSINISKMPNPTINYSSNQIYFESMSDGGAGMYFCQELKGVCYSVINIVYSKHSLKEFWVRCIDFFGRLEAWVADNIKEYDSLGEIDSNLPDNFKTERLIVERCSVERIAYRREDSEIQFYMTKPYAIHFATNSSKHLSDVYKPVVSILISTRDLYLILMKVRNVVELNFPTLSVELSIDNDEVSDV